ncbi:hypothetical protein DFH11DRAFT_760961 [Phellopilus nigrolimitatus]|nr:hypothetical protein DFH11DRAFT_760961 [Phellopilus nigrolimitatus]
MLLSTMQDHSEIERTSSHRPFDAFPPELLAACFLALKEALTEDRGSGEYRLYRWISVTLVCRQWRDVALSSSTLWTGVSTRYGLEAVRKLLLLSKAALLSVLVRPSPGTPRQETEKVLRLIQTHAHRIQSLVVIVGRELDPFTIIDLRSYGRLNMILVNSMGVPASIRSLGGIAEPPNPLPVKDLILVGCHVPWYPWILTGLTRLDIRFARSSGIPTVKAVFAILGHCAALQFLTLSGFVDGVDREVETLPVKKLTLPHLAVISIKKMTAHQCVLFLNYLSLPANVTWLVNVTDYDRDSDADAMRLPSPHPNSSPL